MFNQSSIELSFKKSNMRTRRVYHPWEHIGTVLVNSTIIEVWIILSTN